MSDQQPMLAHSCGDNDNIASFRGSVDGGGLVGVLTGVGDGAAVLSFLATGRISHLYCVDSSDRHYQNDTASGESGVAARTRLSEIADSAKRAVDIVHSFSEVPTFGHLDFAYLSPTVSTDEFTADLADAVALNPRVVGGAGYSHVAGTCGHAVDLRFGRPDRELPDSTWVVYSPLSRHAPIAVPKLRTRGLPLAKCVDGALVVCFTGNPVRAAAHKADSARVGLSVEQVWQFPTPFDKYFSDSVPHTGQFDEHSGWANSWFGHYRAIKLAYERGYRTALIIEDDCRFLLDARKVDEIAADMPEDADFALFDHFYCNWDDKNRANYGRLRDTRVTRYWSRFDYGFYSAACYFLSRKAMDRIIWLHESVIDPKTAHRMMRVTDYWHNRGNLGPINMYFCTPNCAIQRNPDNSSVRLSDTSGINRYYVNMGIRFDAYAGGGEVAPVSSVYGKEKSDVK